MARLNMNPDRQDSWNIGRKNTSSISQQKSSEIIPISPRKGPQRTSTKTRNADNEKNVQRPETSRKQPTIPHDGENKTGAVSEIETNSDLDSSVLPLDSLSEGAAALELKSPRKTAPRQRAYFVRDSIDLGADSTSADEGQDDQSADDSSLSDFIVDDSASESELRKPPRSMRKAQEQPRTFRRLVRRSPTKRVPSLYEDSDDEVRVSKPDADGTASSPGNRSSQGSAGVSDVEDRVIEETDLTVKLSETLDEALRLSPPKDVGGSETNKENTPAPSPSRRQLQSPSRNRVNIPSLPHQESIENFWDQQEVDEWNDVHSPRKIPRDGSPLFPLLSPSKSNALKELLGSDSDDDRGALPSVKPPIKSPERGTSKSPTKGSRVRDRSAVEAKKKFDKEKHEIASQFLAELDSTITHGEIARLSASTGGVKLEWNKKLNSTAGRAKWKRERTRVRSPASSSLSPRATDSTPKVNNKSKIHDGHINGSTSSSSFTPPSTDVITHHHASIELAEKVIDDEDRLLNVLAHEFCHLATFIISNVRDSPHGREFKAWAGKVSGAFSDRGIAVTTKHSYAINYRYVWACSSCAQEYKRHSRSIDPAKHVCSSCKTGRLVQVQPVPRNNNNKSTNAASRPIGGEGDAEGSGGGGSSSSSSSNDKNGKAGGAAPEDETSYQAFVRGNFAKVKAELLTDLQQNQQQGGRHREGDASGTKGAAAGPAWGEVMAELAKRWKVEKAARGQKTPKMGRSSRSDHASEHVVNVDSVTERLVNMFVDPASAAC